MFSAHKLGILIALIAAPLTLDAQAIKIRVINLNNGRPLPNQHVSIALSYEKGQKAPAKYDANLRLETDVDGEAVLHLPEPAPAHLLVSVRLTSEYWHCSCLAIGDTPDLVQKGLVQSAGREPAGPATNAKPEPGVVLFLARPFTFLERLLYPLMKE
jgi:hypothetical protein